MVKNFHLLVLAVVLALQLPGQNFRAYKQTRVSIASSFRMEKGNADYAYLAEEFPHFIHVQLQPSRNISFFYNTQPKDTVAARLEIIHATLAQQDFGRQQQTNVSGNAYSNSSRKVDLRNWRVPRLADFEVYGNFIEYQGLFNLDIYVIGHKDGDHLLNINPGPFTATEVGDVFAQISDKLFAFINSLTHEKVLYTRIATVYHGKPDTTDFINTEFVGRYLAADNNLQKKLKVVAKPNLTFASEKKLEDVCQDEKANVLICNWPDLDTRIKKYFIYNRFTRDTLILALKTTDNTVLRSQYYYWANYGLNALIDSNALWNHGFAVWFNSLRRGNEKAIVRLTDSLTEKGYYNLALFLAYDFVSKTGTEKSPLYLRLARLSVLKRDDYLAEKYAQFATVKEKDEVLYYANTMYELRNYSEAVAYYRKFEKLVGHDTVQLQQARALFYKGDYKETDNELMKYLAYDPENPEALKFKGLVCFGQEIYDCATDYFKKIPNGYDFQKSAYLSYSYYNWALQQSKDTSLSISLLWKAIAYDEENKNMSAYNALLRLYNAQRKITEADSLITKGIRRGMWLEENIYSSQALYLYRLKEVGDTLLRRQILLKVLYYVQQLEKKNKADYSSLTLAGLVLNDLNRPGALSYFKKANDISRESSVGYLNLAEAYIMHNQPDSALSTLDQMAKESDFIRENQSKSSLSFLRLVASRMIMTKAQVAPFEKDFEESLKSNGFSKGWDFSAFENWRDQLNDTDLKNDLITYTRKAKAVQSPRMN